MIDDKDFEVQQALHERLIKHKEEHGLTWFNLAVQIGVHTMTLSFWRRLGYVGGKSVERVRAYLDNYGRDENVNPNS